MTKETNSKNYRKKWVEINNCIKCMMFLSIKKIWRNSEKFNNNLSNAPLNLIYHTLLDQSQLNPDTCSLRELEKTIHSQVPIWSEILIILYHKNSLKNRKSLKQILSLTILRQTLLELTSICKGCKDRGRLKK